MIQPVVKQLAGAMGGRITIQRYQVEGSNRQKVFLIHSPNTSLINIYSPNQMAVNIILITVPIKELPG